jgi:hypothetical protein
MDGRDSSLFSYVVSFFSLLVQKGILLVRWPLCILDGMVDGVLDVSTWVLYTAFLLFLRDICFIHEDIISSSYSFTLHSSLQKTP